ncbi:MAG: hypothetical protein K9M56_00850 [Victivallales bacterium]|nr:hypothetical protein [Victivallales bacterium]
MLSFCGQDRSRLDANGRIKLSPRFISDFQKNGGGEVVLHCLPEGALAVYPEKNYLKMREDGNELAEKAGLSMVSRRKMRRFGALSRTEKITSQGRITVPAPYREYASLTPGEEVTVVGCEIGVEIWSTSQWASEMEIINSHFREKGEREMSSDLLH